MPLMNRVLYAVLACAALAPMTAAAAPSPTPSPALPDVILPAPSGFSELTSSTFHGEFTAHYYATSTGSKDAAAIEATLNHDGYVDGYGKTWIQATAGHALVDAVIAFTGAKGARDWLSSAEIGDKSDPAYKHADTVTGLGTYYGGHFTYANTTQADVFAFVKGNDVFLVGAESAKDDVLALATSQATAQYVKAPAATIPSSQWPENKSSGLSAGSAAGPIVGVIVILVVVAGVLLVGGLIIRSRRRALVPAAYGAMPFAAGAVPPAPPAVAQMSEDGNFWWDGGSWRNAALEAPPGAQRSSDGGLWWDGRNWRPVPAGAPAPGSSPF